MSIADVAQSLVDDNMVHKDKIGSGNYFWAFPSEAASIVRCIAMHGLKCNSSAVLTTQLPFLQRQNKKADLEKKVAGLQKRSETALAAIEAETAGREPTVRSVPHAG
jgi:hypothetical protein